MMTRSLTRPNLLLAGSLIVLLIAQPAFTQQAGDKPAAPSAAAPDASKPVPSLQPQDEKKPLTP
jgi:hypothetical protein